MPKAFYRACKTLYNYHPNFSLSSIFSRDTIHGVMGGTASARADHCRCRLVRRREENSLITIHDVARLARTSTATVSQTLNRPDRVAAKTRRRVLAAIQKLKYYPNLHARSLASRVSHTLGIIVSDIQNPFYPDAIRSFEARARHLGYEVLISATNYKPQLMRRATERMLKQKVRGVAILTSEMSPRLIKELIERKVAVVCNDFELVGGRVSNIKFDYSSGVGQAVRHLYEFGHRRIAYVGGRSLKNIKARQAAYIESMRQFGLQPGPIILGNQSAKGGTPQACKSLNSHRAPRPPSP